MIKAAIFDVDGTLVDSNVLHVEAWREAFSQYGKELSADEVHAQMGKGGDQLMPVFLSRHELDSIGGALEKLRSETFTRITCRRSGRSEGTRAFRGLKATACDRARVIGEGDELATHIEKLGVAESSTRRPCRRRRALQAVSRHIRAALARLDDVAEEAIVIVDTPYDAMPRAGRGFARSVY